MARNITASIEAKAKSASSKSEGMRMLFDAGKTVSEVSSIMNVNYAFAYGVAKRHGVVEQAASRRAPSKDVATKANSKGKSVGKGTLPSKATTRQARTVAREQKAAPAARIARSRVAQPVEKPGRPSAARRAANRAPRVVAAPTKLSAAAKSRIAANR